MKTNPMLEEVWRTKDELAREAGYDTHRFFADLRRWAREHPHAGPVLCSAEDLRRFAAEAERRRAKTAHLELNDKPLSPPI